jgi:hypothetical protein
MPDAKPKERTMNTAMRLGLAVAVALSTGGRASAADPTTPEESARMRTALVEWFECEECEEGQLAAVVRFGDAVVPSLAATLEGGPGPASRELLRRELEKRHRELVAYAKDHPEAKPASSEREFVALYLDNYDALYRSRAAQALGAVGTDAAVAALQRALEAKYRPDVQRSIEQAISTVRAKQP